MIFKTLKPTLLILFAIILSPINALALDVESLRFGLHENKTRLVLDLDQNVDFRAFTLPDPYRLVIDLPAFTWKAGATNTSSSKSGVRATRHGNLQPGISRIVFDMNRAISIQNAFTLPPAPGGNGNTRLVIDFSNASPSVFKQTQNTVHGRLTPNKTTQTTRAAPPQPSSPEHKNTLDHPLIIIDPGHGGIDPGAIGANKLREKDIVLKLAKELKKQLEAGGYRVKMTRDRDIFVKLRDRVKFARKHKGDLFVSIHADSLENRKVRGASLYTLSEKASDAQSARLAARENKADLIAGIDLNVEDEDVADILLDLAVRETSNQSNFFAGTLVNAFKSHNVRLLQTAHRSAGFAVLKAPDIPSILVESGFMSNTQEANLLNTPAHRKKIVQSLKKGIDRYFDQVRKNQRL